MIAKGNGRSTNWDDYARASYFSVNFNEEVQNNWNSFFHVIFFVKSKEMFK